MSKEWIYLTIAGFLEIGWLAALKYSEGFTRLWPTITMFTLAISSLYLVSLAVKQVPAGTVYAVWTGIGATGGAIMGIMLFNESREFIRLASITLIVIGIVGLKITDASN